MRDTNKTKKLPSFRERVYDVVRNIPVGSTHTYQAVAPKAGSPRAYRRVATLMKENYNPDIPCHRVIKSDGTVGDYNRGGEVMKRRLLRQERAQAQRKDSTCR